MASSAEYYGVDTDVSFPLLFSVPSVSRWFDYREEL